MTGSGKLRLDKWLWYARFFKSRAIASDLCRAHKVRINGVHCKKASATIIVGDVLTFPQANAIKVIEIVALGTRRGPATEAALLYKDLSPVESATRNEEKPLENPSREKGMGRPTKSDRRALDRLRDHE
ncbi:RNA-binding S4 domain-containing protein [Kordiimonas aquimaris]|uniref:RNA-binding S4 domain-containing protein n=1 Tax=Kordiimonas aquimaris TaxID=707591 RepID=UPI0021D2C76B|nr:RNA-binding S4 domain-containing protein [Kordiimonas aquimaris]